ncbi:MAG: hypothetical protein Q7Q71_06400 [Verrucomicrobiota bacterium JB023]|nr:hypothetical protein [Verrucomicrobiota bacterium JB023]
MRGEIRAKEIICHAIQRLGNAPQIEHVGFKDVRGLRRSNSMNYAVSLRRQIYPTVEDDDVPTTD